MRHASKRAIRASIHAPAREATMATITPARPAIWFQSTPPHGRRHHGKHHVTRLCESFNPRLRTGGDKTEGDVGTPWSVSIHASAREATRNVWKSSTAMSCFNPRLRTGGDVASRREEEAHACFNPRLRTGGDALRSAATPRTHWFQSTPPHGRRRQRYDFIMTNIRGFNPRLRTGGDSRWVEACAQQTSFNPRLRTGGDVRLSCSRRLGHQVSIHASAREATSRAIRPAA